MKLYAITYIDDEKMGEREAVWVGTQADQKKDAKSLKTYGMREIEQHQVDVPTNKPDLLAWLNARGVRP